MAAPIRSEPAMASAMAPALAPSGIISVVVRSRPGSATGVALAEPTVEPSKDALQQRRRMARTPQGPTTTGWTMERLQPWTAGRRRFGPAVEPFSEKPLSEKQRFAQVVTAPTASLPRPHTASPRMPKPTTIVIPLMRHPDHPFWKASPRPAAGTALHAVRHAVPPPFTASTACAPPAAGADLPLAPRKANLSAEEAAAIRLQAQTRGSAARQELGRTRMNALQERAQRDAKAQAEAAARLQSVHRGRRTRRKLQAGEDPAAVAVSMARAAAVGATGVRGEGAMEPLAIRALSPARNPFNEKLKWAIGTQTAQISASKGAASLEANLEAADLTYVAFDPLEPEDVELAAAADDDGDDAAAAAGARGAPGSGRHVGRAALSRKEELHAISRLRSLFNVADRKLRAVSGVMSAADEAAGSSSTERATFERRTVQLPLLSADGVVFNDVQLLAGGSQLPFSQLLAGVVASASRMELCASGCLRLLPPTSATSSAATASAGGASGAAAAVAAAGNVLFPWPIALIGGSIDHLGVHLLRVSTGGTVTRLEHRSALATISKLKTTPGELAVNIHTCEISKLETTPNISAGAPQIPLPPAHPQPAHPSTPRRPATSPAVSPRRALPASAMPSGPRFAQTPLAPPPALQYHTLVSAQYSAAPPTVGLISRSAAISRPPSAASHPSRPTSAASQRPSSAASQRDQARPSSRVSSAARTRAHGGATARAAGLSCGAVVSEPAHASWTPDSFTARLEVDLSAAVPLALRSLAWWRLALLYLSSETTASVAFESSFALRWLQHQKLVHQTRSGATPPHPALIAKLLEKHGPLGVMALGNGARDGAFEVLRVSTVAAAAGTLGEVARTVAAAPSVPTVSSSAAEAAYVRWLAGSGQGRSNLIALSRRAAVLRQGLAALHVSVGTAAAEAPAAGSAVRRAADMLSEEVLHEQLALQAVRDEAAAHTELPARVVTAVLHVVGGERLRLVSVAQVQAPTHVYVRVVPSTSELLVDGLKPGTLLGALPGLSGAVLAASAGQLAPGTIAASFRLVLRSYELELIAPSEEIARLWVRGVNHLPLGGKHRMLLALARRHAL